MQLRRWHLAIVLILMLFLQGCKQIDLNVEGKITAPEVNESPIQGSWKIDSSIYIDDTVTSTDKENYIGETATFDKSTAVLGIEVCKFPVFEIRSVSADEYFLYKFKIDPVKLGIKEKMINVVTVSSKQQPFYDFIKINDSSMLVYENHELLHMSKVSDKIDNYISQSNTNSDIDKESKTSINQDSLLRSGIFLGLRSSKSDNSTASSYRTLWIASKNRELRPVYETKQLLVPRRNGFWKIDYWSQMVTGILKGTLYAHPITDNTDYKIDNSDLLEEYGKRDICFVGNDYIGTEYRYIDPAGSKVTDKYQVLPIDNIRGGQCVNISDIASNDGQNAFIHSSESYIKSLDKTRADLLEKEIKDDNFSLSRHNGQWIVTGRLNYLTPIEGKNFEDFNVYLILPKKLINYDELKLTWNYIKAKVPEALDAYTSPNNDLTIIITKNTIEVYTVSNERLSDKPLRTLAKQNNESVVMAEWAIGGYMENWEKIAKSQATEITDNITK